MFGGEPKAHDLLHTMRLPRFIHQKNKDAPFSLHFLLGSDGGRVGERNP
jgi:hypothetical protein